MNDYRKKEAEMDCENEGDDSECGEGDFNDIIGKMFSEEYYKCYSFTFSPEGNTLNINNAYIFYARYIYAVFKKSKLGGTKFVIVPEMNKRGNIHYHGVFVFYKKYQYFTFFKTFIWYFKKRGFVLVKEVFELQKWIGYLRKEQELMKRVLNIEPYICLDNKDIFDSAVIRNSGVQLSVKRMVE